MDEPIRILVSACLLGEPVRYDGGHKRDGFLVGTVGPLVEWVRVCPEADCGLPTPREAMRLSGEPSSPRLVGGESGLDYTDRMMRWAGRRLRELEPMGLCAYICKEGSPSSGMARVKVYDGAGVPRGTAAGLFTKAFLERFPLVPVEEEGRIRDPAVRDAFFENVFTLRRFRARLARRKTVRGLVEFHTEHKLLLLARGRAHYAAMGALVAGGSRLPAGELYERYTRLLLEALSAKPTAKKRSDVLLHAMGHFRRSLAPEEKREFLSIVGRYREGQVPLAVPATLLRRFVGEHGAAWLARQVFLDPHPVERMLRGQV